MKQIIDIDNSVPIDPDYPIFSEADFQGERIVYVNDGDYIVDTDGRIEIVTSGNVKWRDNPAVYADWNRGFLRARYLGNRDDAMEYANQIRLATSEEIKIAKQYEVCDRIKIGQGGQLALL